MQLQEKLVMLEDTARQLVKISFSVGGVCNGATSLAGITIGLDGRNVTVSACVPDTTFTIHITPGTGKTLLSNTSPNSMHTSTPHDMSFGMEPIQVKWSNKVRFTGGVEFK